MELLTQEIINAALTKARETGVPCVLDDGGRLFLDVKASGAASWIHRFQWAGKGDKMGMGAIYDRGLEDARELAAKARRLVRKGIHPRTLLNADGSLAAEGVRTPLFEDYAWDIMLKDCETAPGAKPRHAKHRESWERDLGLTIVDGKRVKRAGYLASLHGKMMHEITPTDVFKALDPIWKAKSTTARNTRQRLARVINAACGEFKCMETMRNPADEKLVKAKLGEQPKKGSVRGSHASLHWKLVPQLWVELRSEELKNSPVSRALQWCLLCPPRSCETRQMTFTQVVEHATEAGEQRWVVPGKVMKNGKLDGDFPMTPTMLAFFEEMKALRDEGETMVFPARVKAGVYGEPIGERSMLALLQKTLGYDGKRKPKATVHGTARGSFRSWGQQQKLGHDRETLEFCLHHIEGSEAEIAYKHDDVWHKRKAALTDWQAHVTSLERQGDGVARLDAWRERNAKVAA